MFALAELYNIEGDISALARFVITRPQSLDTGHILLCSIISAGEAPAVRAGVCMEGLSSGREERETTEKTALLSR